MALFRLLHCLAVVVLVVVIAAIAACSATLAGKAIPDRHNHPSSIYVVNHGWHTGLVLPAAMVADEMPWPLERSSNNSQFLEIGWGDQGFYQAEEITAWLAVKALFWPTASVYHVVALDTIPASAFPGSESMELRVSQQAIMDLLAFLKQWVARDELGQVIYLGRGLYGDSGFYRATPTYHGFYTCNQFTADALEAAGVEMPDWFSLRSATVMRQLAPIAANHYIPNPDR